MSRSHRPDCPMSAFPPFASWPLRLVGGLVLCAVVGCGRGAVPAEEHAPPATVKWEGPVQGALEEWTELFGTTTPLPDRVARVTAPVEGRVLTVLGDAGGPPVIEGQRVEKGAVLVQLDPTVVQAALAKAEAAQEVLKEEQRQAQFAVDLAAAEVERLRRLQPADDAGPGGRPLVSAADRFKADVALKDAQSTDSVAKQIDYGFAGDVGTTPPMDHRIDETGISTPACFEESREGSACK